jgi:hypothetical protein
MAIGHEGDTVSIYERQSRKIPGLGKCVVFNIGPGLDGSGSFLAINILHCKRSRSVNVFLRWGYVVDKGDCFWFDAQYLSASDFRDSLIILSLADPPFRLSEGLHFSHEVYGGTTWMPLRSIAERQPLQ